MLVVTIVYFFVEEEEKCRKKQLFSIVNGKVSQSLGKNVFFFFLMNEQKFETFFFLSYKIKYFKSNAINAILSQQNLRGKLLNVGKKQC